MNVLRRILKALVWLAVLGSAAGAAVYWGPGLYRQWGGGGASENSRAAEVRFHTVARGTLQIGIVESGRLRAVKHHKISSELNGQAKVSWIVPEGTHVKKGDKLVEFEKKRLEEELTKTEADLDAEKRQLTVAEESLKIEDSSGKAMLAAAETHLKEAKDALKKYRELEAPQQFKQLDAATSTAREKLVQAQQALADVQRKADEALFVEDEQKKNIERQITGAKEAVTAARKAVDAAVLQQKMFKAYDYPRAYESKKQGVANADLDLAKTKVAVQSQFLQKEAQLGHVKDSITHMTRDIEEHRKELAHCIITAPAEGMVLYGEPEQRGRMYGRSTEIKVGADCYRGNTILTIPDLSAFEVDIAINEEHRGRLKPGCKARVTVEAVPGLAMDGNLKQIFNLARPRIPWDESSPKVFDGIVELPQADLRMVSGMTTRVEISVETVPDVLRAPIEAVFNEQGETVCYARQGEGFERRRVKTARSNDDFVEIAEGLAEGDQVYLFNPTQGEGAGDNARPQG